MQAQGVVLHVEDEEATRFVVRSTLEHAGFQVRSATNLAEGAALLDGVDLAILDMNLPDGLGIDLCTRIKQQHHLPVLILSATSTGPADRAYGLDRGADGYLTHPVEPMVLVATVRAMVRAHKAELVKRRILGIVGHDLRTPLMVISTSVDLLERYKDKPERRAPVRDNIRAAAARMERIVSDLLDYTRLERAGGLPMRREPVDLDAICAEVVGEVRVAVPDRPVELVASGSGRVIGDSARLAQMVDNLVVNAVKFSPPGTPPVRVVRERATESVVLRVSNSGPPIPVEARDHLFEAFFRATPEHGALPSGSGLGLFIARAIAEAHGGALRLDHSDAERGTEFRVDLPAA